LALSVATPKKCFIMGAAGAPRQTLEFSNREWGETTLARSSGVREHFKLTLSPKQSGENQPDKPERKQSETRMTICW